MKSPLFVLFCLLSLGLFAQNETETESESKKKYNLTLRFDYGLSLLSMNERVQYTGEYFNTATETWDWIEQDTSFINQDFITAANNVKFDLMISIIEPLNIGLSYNFILYKEQEPGPSFISTWFSPFFSIAGVIDYHYQVPGTDWLYINPSITGGIYQANEEYIGVGTELYLDGRLAVEARYKDRLGLRAWSSYHMLNYSQNTDSEVFSGMKVKRNSLINGLFFGVGLSYRFYLIPD